MGFIKPEEGLELMEVGGLNKIYERIQVDKRQAQRENLKMSTVTEEMIKEHQETWLESVNPASTKDVDAGMQLEPPPIISVNTWDRHEVHIEMHNLYRKSQSFERAEPHTRMLFEEHVRMHTEALAGMIEHPLTGMDPSNPNAPAPEDEEAALDEMDQEEQQTGPKPMPDLSEETPSEGVM